MRGIREPGGAFLQDVPAIIEDGDIVRLSEGTFFGELAALGRVPRSVNICRETCGSHGDAMAGSQRHYEGRSRLAKEN